MIRGRQPRIGVPSEPRSAGKPEWLGRTAVAVAPYALGRLICTGLARVRDLDTIWSA